MGIKNTGTLVTAAIRPNNSDDKIASAYAVEIKGGLHSYATKNDRNSIITERREWGMLCNVYNDGVNNGTYQLVYGKMSTNIMDNLNWVKFVGSGSGTSGGSAYWIDPVKSVESNEPGSPTDGDRYILGPSPTGVVWGVGSFVEDVVVQYDSTTSTWKITTPMDGMSVRVNDQDNSIYRYEISTTSWIKEKENQLLSVAASSNNGIAYTATDQRVFSYDVDSLYMVQFATANAGGTVTLNINGLGAKTIKQQTDAGLLSFSGKDISTSVKYNLQYDGTYFRLTKPQSDPTLVKYRIQTSETVVVPAYQEYLVYGDLEVNGFLNVDPLGKVVVVNGALNINGGTVSNSGNVHLITLATSVSNVAVRKYATSVALPNGTPISITHNLNSMSIFTSVYDGFTLVTSNIDISLGSSNDITITNNGTSIASANVVIMG